MEILPNFYVNSPTSDLSYRGPKGFEFWADKFPNCRGKRQSPINIDTDVAKTVRLKPLFFSRSVFWSRSSKINDHVQDLNLEYKVYYRVTR